MLQNLLATCGLNESEQKVLIVLLERGANIASILAKHTHLKRPTVYAALENLIQTGLVTRQKKDQVTIFSAVPSHQISKILEQNAKRQFEDVQYASHALNSRLQELSKYATKEMGGFSLTTIESSSAIYTELEEALLQGDFCAIFNPQEAMATDDMEAMVLGFLKKTEKTEPRIREIAVAGTKTDKYVAHIQNPNHEVRQIEKDEKILSDIILYNGFVFLSHHHPGREVGIKVHHPDFYTSMMTVFEMLWSNVGRI